MRYVDRFGRPYLQIWHRAWARVEAVQAANLFHLHSLTDVAGLEVFGPRSCDSRPAMLLLSAATLLVSAALLFIVEPMFAKMVLPLLGGTPAVWNTCVVFFQATMLLAYLYVHVSTSRLRPRHQAVLHAVIVLLPFAVLPVTVDHGWVTDRRRGPHSMADRSDGARRRTAVLRRRNDCATRAAVVLSEWTPPRARPVLPLCRQQRRQPDRAVVVSRCARAWTAPVRPELVLDARVRRARRADPGVHGGGVAAIGGWSRLRRDRG